MAVARRFENDDPSHRPHRLSAVVRWGIVDRLLGRRRVEPPGPPARRVAADRSAILVSDGADRLTWIGHASFLAIVDGAPILIDPHLSDHAGFFFRRSGRPGLLFDDLPTIAALLVTHNHYDHLDAPTVLRLPRAVRVFCPLGLGGWFRRRGFSRVKEMGWWDSADGGGPSIHFVPARHWSRRRVGDTNRSWWGGFVITGRRSRVYHAGDSSAFPGFAEIGGRFPGLTAALLPVGSYAPAWFMEHYHLNPEQAGAAFLDTGARTLVPIHWGAFQLTDEPLCEPADRIRRWWAVSGPRDGRSLGLLAVGETLSL